MHYPAAPVIVRGGKVAAGMGAARLGAEGRRRQQSLGGNDQIGQLPVVALARRVQDRQE
jgi:hypothetical protein